MRERDKAGTRVKRWQAARPGGEVSSRTATATATAAAVHTTSVGHRRERRRAKEKAATEPTTGTPHNRRTAALPSVASQLARPRTLSQAGRRTRRPRHWGATRLKARPAPPHPSPLVDQAGTMHLYFPLRGPTNYQGWNAYVDSYMAYYDLIGPSPTRLKVRPHCQGSLISRWSTKPGPSLPTGRWGPNKLLGMNRLRGFLHGILWFHRSVPMRLKVRPHCQGSPISRWSTRPWSPLPAGK